MAPGDRWDSKALWSSSEDAISEKGGREVAESGRGKSESEISEGSPANQKSGM